MTIQKVELADADTLLALSKKTFYDSFAHLNKPEDIKAYADVSFVITQVIKELNNPDSEFYFAVIDGQIVGYLKLNYNDAQTDVHDKNAIEVERIYVLTDQHGKNIGGKLLNFAVETAVEKQMNFIWLGVWQHNHKAIGFYRHKGFEVFGNHGFMLGDDKQNDLLMKKMLV
jgi:GNAT superfamily N-acetyltransferase